MDQDLDYAIALSLSESINNEDDNHRRTPTIDSSSSTRNSSKTTDKYTSMATTNTKKQLPDMTTTSKKGNSSYSTEKSNEDEDYQLALSLSLNESLDPTIKSNKDESFFSKLSSQFFSSLNQSNTSSNGRICQACHQSLGYGRYISFQEKYYHPQCLKCNHCHIPIQGQICVHSDQFYHPSCGEILFSLKCCLCDANIHGKYYQDGFFKDQIFCSSHINQSKSRKCFSCNRYEPISPNKERFVDYPDGRISCGICVSTAIFDSSEASSLYHNVIQFMENILEFPIPQEMRQVPILAVDLNALNEKVNVSNHSNAGLVRGLTLSQIGEIRHISAGNIFRNMLLNPMLSQYTQTATQTQQIFRVEEVREVTAVLVLYGLPSVLTASILAHEAMHVWIRLKKDFPFFIPSKIEEGICQYIASKYLQYLKSSQSVDKSLQVIQSSKSNSASGYNKSTSSLNSTRMGNKSDKDQEILNDFFLNQIETDTSLVYGDGYREVKRVADVLSLDVVLDYIRENKALPSI